MRELREQRGLADSSAGTSTAPIADRHSTFGTPALIEAAQDLLTEFFAQRWSHKVLVIQYKYYVQLGSGMSEAALCAAACAALGVRGFSVIDLNPGWLPGVAHRGRSSAERSLLLATLNHPMLPPVPSRSGLSAAQLCDQIRQLRDGTIWARAVMCGPHVGQQHRCTWAHVVTLVALLLGVLAMLWYT